MTNLFGFALDHLDLPWFLKLTRLAFVILALLGALMAARSVDDKRAGRIVLWVGIVGHALAWFATMFPLPNVYGANGSMDRENHLGFANVVALGFSPLRTSQVNHLHFEPLWPLLTAIGSGFNVDRVPMVFQWTPLIVGVALLFAIRFAWVRGFNTTPTAQTEGSFAALGALLLLAVPDDFSGPFRNPWALTFLLKPNHSLGLVLVPLAALAISRASSWRSRFFAGFVLQLVGWAFVLHMALFVAGLLVFVAVSWVLRSEDRRRNLVDIGTAVGVNLLIVSPYIVMLVASYPFLQGMDAYRLSPFSERPVEGPLRLGVLFLLSAFGAWQTYQGASRFGRILATQWLTAHVIWQAFPILGLFGQAREQDEAFYWCRFWTGLFAGVGAFLLARSVTADLQAKRARIPPAIGLRPAGAALILLLPSLLPTWWNPTRMDQYFVAARNPLPDWIDEPARFIRTRTDEDAVFTGDRSYARWISAYGARRVLMANSLNVPTDKVKRRDIDVAFLTDGPKSLLQEGVSRYGLRYLLATSEPLEQAPGLTLDELQKRSYLEVVYERQFVSVRVIIFKIVLPSRELG